MAQIDDTAERRQAILRQRPDPFWVLMRGDAPSHDQRIGTLSVLTDITQSVITGRDDGKPAVDAAGRDPFGKLAFPGHDAAACEPAPAQYGSKWCSSQPGQTTGQSSPQSFAW